MNSTIFKPTFDTSSGGGASIGAYTGYTATIIATGTNPTLGVGTTYQAYYRVLGAGSLHIVYSLNQSSGGTAGTGTYIWPLPTGFTPNSTVVSTSTTVSGGIVGAASVDAVPSTVKAYDNGTKKGLALSNGSGNVGSGNSPLSNTAMTYSFSAIVPVNE